LAQANPERCATLLTALFHAWTVGRRRTG
jgi:hypothetical protein